MNSSPTRPMQAAIFDLDGTLVDSRQAVVEAVAQGVADGFEAHGIDDVVPDESAIMDAMGLPPAEYYQRILPTGLHSLAREVQDAATEHEVNALADGHGRLHEGVIETLDELRRRGLKLAIISNAQAPYFRACLRYLELAEQIDHAECHEELPADGPGGKVVLLTRALAALGRTAGACLMVGDRREDVSAGRELGCVSVGLSYGFGSTAELAEADFRLDQFSGLLRLID